MNLRFDNCPNCFANLNGNSVCSNCNTDITKIKEYSSALQVFTLLKDRYLLGKVLGKGGFGITYLVQDIVTGKHCCIKEYLPSEFAKRSEDGYTLLPLDNSKEGVNVYEHGKKRFIEEARTLIMLKENKVVVDIIDFFEQNNTAYFVMEYLDGVSMKRLTGQYNGRLPEGIAKKILEVIGMALMDVHNKGMLHRDISPENIFITKNMEVKLIDFGAARDYIKTQNKGMSVVLKAGYAPPEQYNSKGMQGPWTDIYALAATYYTCVSGEKLLDSMFLMQGMTQPELIELKCGVDKTTSDVIKKAMNINYKERYLNARDFLVALGVDINSMNNLIEEETVVEADDNKTADTRSQENKDIYIDIGKECNEKPLVEFLGNDVIRRKINIPENYIVKIGRSSICDLVVRKVSTISRVHLLIAYDRKINKFRVTDKSANGTFMSNGVRLLKDNETLLDSNTVLYLANKENIIKIMLE